MTAYASINKMEQCVCYLQLCYEIFVFCNEPLQRYTQSARICSPATGIL